MHVGFVLDGNPNRHVPADLKPAFDFVGAQGEAPAQLRDQIEISHWVGA